MADYQRNILSDNIKSTEKERHIGWNTAECSLNWPPKLCFDLIKGPLWPCERAALTLPKWLFRLKRVWFAIVKERIQCRSFSISSFCRWCFFKAVFKLISCSAVNMIRHHFPLVALSFRVKHAIYIRLCDKVSVFIKIVLISCCFKSYLCIVK